MICKLCKQREADKKNTHYLTDAIIRPCLNQDGSNQREKGCYGKFSNEMNSMEFNFQRNTSLEKLKETLGREPTEEEIEKAHQIPFSVDYYFCSDCEKIFTEIENEFCNTILPRFRQQLPKNKQEDEITDIKSIRLFFYLQLWRTHICDEHFQLDENVAEKMRQFLLGHKEINVSELTNYPLSVCYLETPSNEEYTRNRVEVRNNKNPYVIFMNDFIIRFYDSIELVEQKYHDLINYKEKKVFRVFICSDEQRKQFLENNSRFDADDFLEKQKKLFIDKWVNKLGKEPGQSIINEYLATLVEGDIETDALKYSVERTAKLQNDIISKYMRINKDKKNTTGITIKGHKGVISNSRNKHTKNKRHKFRKWIWIKKIYKRIKRRKREK